ncbi:unnamed protein product, partial [Closterium sp. Naga37s-1]
MKLLAEGGAAESLLHEKKAGDEEYQGEQEEKEEEKEKGEEMEKEEEKEEEGEAKEEEQEEKVTKQGGVQETVATVPSLPCVGEVEQGGPCVGYQGPWTYLLPLALFVLTASWIAVGGQCLAGSDVLMWRSFYAMRDRAWRAHYREMFNWSIREILCCMGRARPWDEVDDEVDVMASLLAGGRDEVDDEVDIVASLLGDEVDDEVDIVASLLGDVMAGWTHNTSALLRSPHSFCPRDEVDDEVDIVADEVDDEVDIVASRLGDCMTGPTSPLFPFSSLLSSSFSLFPRDEVDDEVDIVASRLGDCMTGPTSPLFPFSSLLSSSFSLFPRDEVYDEVDIVASLLGDCMTGPTSPLFPFSSLLSSSFSLFPRDEVDDEVDIVASLLGDSVMTEPTSPLCPFPSLLSQPILASCLPGTRVNSQTHSNRSLFCSVHAGLALLQANRPSPAVDAPTSSSSSSSSQSTHLNALPSTTAATPLSSTTAPSVFDSLNTGGTTTTSSSSVGSSSTIGSNARGVDSSNARGVDSSNARGVDSSNARGVDSSNADSGRGFNRGDTEGSSSSERLAEGGPFPSRPASVPITLIEEAAALLPLAIAAYTGPLLDMGRYPFTFACAWVWRQGMFFPWQQSRYPSLQGDNWWRGHASAFLKYLHLPPSALRKARVRQEEAGQAVYFVVVLHQLRLVVVAVRGTESLEDMIIDGLGRECPLSDADMGGIDRQCKVVVVAVRGTESLEDMIIDGLGGNAHSVTRIWEALTVALDPWSVSEWNWAWSELHPPLVTDRLVPYLGHAGVVTAARDIPLVALPNSVTSLLTPLSVACLPRSELHPPLVTDRLVPYLGHAGVVTAARDIPLVALPNSVTSLLTPLSVACLPRSELHPPLVTDRLVPYFGHAGVVTAARDLALQLDNMGDGEDEEGEGTQGKAGSMEDGGGDDEEGSLLGQKERKRPRRGILSELLGEGGECEGYGLRLVGHSMGGAVCSLTAIRVSECFPGEVECREGREGVSDASLQQLRLVGNSMGGAVCSLTAIRVSLPAIGLRKRFPELRAIGYGSMPCVDFATASACSNFITTHVPASSSAQSPLPLTFIVASPPSPSLPHHYSFVYNDEFSPRTSVASVMRLRAAALRAVAADTRAGGLLGTAVAAVGPGAQAGSAGMRAAAVDRLLSRLFTLPFGIGRGDEGNEMGGVNRVGDGMVGGAGSRGAEEEEEEQVLRHGLHMPRQWKGLGILPTPTKRATAAAGTSSAAAAAAAAAAGSSAVAVAAVARFAAAAAAGADGTAGAGLALAPSGAGAVAAAGGSRLTGYAREDYASLIEYCQAKGDKGAQDWLRENVMPRHRKTKKYLW